MDVAMLCQNKNFNSLCALAIDFSDTRGKRVLLKSLVYCSVLYCLAMLSLAAAAVLVNINTASEAELAEQLPGIGPVKAGAIVDYREQNGPFATVDDIVNVSGIGPATLEKLRPFISVDAADTTGEQAAANAEQNGSTAPTPLTRQQLQLMARAATRAAVQLAIEDAQSSVPRQ